MSTALTRHRPFLAQWLALGMGLLALFALGAVDQHQRQRRAEAREQERLLAMTQVITADIERYLQSVSHVMQLVQQDVADPAATGPHGPRPERLNQHLRMLAAAVPGLLGLRVEEPAVADVPAGPAGHPLLRVSPPFASPDGQGYAIALSRRLTGPRGEPAGAVVATLALEYFYPLLDSMRYTPDTLVGVVHDDGTVLLMAPHTHDMLVGTNLAKPGSLFERHRESGQPATVMSGLVKAVNEPRMISQRTLPTVALGMDKTLHVAISRQSSSIQAAAGQGLWARLSGFALLAGLASAALLAHQRRASQLVQREHAARNALVERERFVRLVTDNIPGQVGYWDADLRCRFANQGYQIALGRPLAELLGRPMPELLGPAQFSAVQAQMQAALQGERQDVERVQALPDGSQRHTWEHCIPDLTPQGVQGLFVLISDIGKIKRSEQALRQFEAIVQSSQDAIVSKTLDGRVTSWNHSATRMYGHTAAEMLGQTLRVLYPADRRDEEQQMLDRLLGGQPVEHFETVRLRKDGSPIDVSLTISPVLDAEGRIVGVSAIAKDISRRVAAERALRDQEAQFRIAIEASTDGFWTTDADGQLLQVNASYLRLSGYERDELLGLQLRDLVADRSPEHLALYLAQPQARGAQRFEGVHLARGGRPWPVEVVSIYTPLHGGRWSAFITDRTEDKKSAELMWHQANFDRLTDLPNRALLLDRLSRACALARRSDTVVALLFADLDGFKPVNDAHGHEAGDQVLVTVARRWRRCLRETDTLARVGGDEFAAVLGGLHHAGEAAQVAEKLLRALDEPIALGDGQACTVGASLGIATFPGNAIEMDSLVAAADAAMYESKRRGKNTCTTSPARPTVEGVSEWVVFGSAHLVGVAEIDNQHRHLVGLVNALNHAIATHRSPQEINSLFQGLIAYTVMHFDTEQRLMQASGYPDMALHLREHEALVHEVQRLSSQVDKGTDMLILQTIKDWLIAHIESSDKAMGAFLAAHGHR